jgi:hypothetical protein
MIIPMKKMMLVIFAGLMMETVTIGAMNPKSPQINKTYAVIVSGINKDPKEEQTKDHAITNLRLFLLNNAGIEPNRLAILTGRPSPTHKDSKLSTADNLNKQINTFAASIRPADRFIFYYVGQANVVAEKLRLNLPGPDITHEQLAIWTKEIKASLMLIVLDCPGAGLAVKALAGKNRIIIGACMEEQVYSTQFSQYFIPALTDLRSDADSDGKISVLEAFTVAARQLDDSYRRQNLLQTETPILEDNADGVPSLQPWRYREDNTDGLVASICFLSRE